MLVTDKTQDSFVSTARRDTGVNQRQDLTRFSLIGCRLSWNWRESQKQDKTRLAISLPLIMKRVNHGDKTRRDSPIGYHLSWNWRESQRQEKARLAIRLPLSVKLAWITETKRHSPLGCRLLWNWTQSHRQDKTTLSPVGYCLWWNGRESQRQSKTRLANTLPLIAKQAWITETILSPVVYVIVDWCESQWQDKTWLVRQ